MKTDKRKLEEIFSLKLFDMFKDCELWGEKERLSWDEYLKGIGCRLVYTPGGLLPKKSPKILHLKDPANPNWRVQVPREVAFKILSLGLP
jgi:hypothetical protein